MKNITQSLKVIILAVTLSFGVSFVYAWTAPTLPPPDGNVSAPINTSATGQYKAGGLGIEGLIRGYGNAIFDGNVGIGTTNPARKLVIRAGSSDGIDISSTNSPDLRFMTDIAGDARNWMFSSQHSLSGFELLRSSVAGSTPDTNVMSFDKNGNVGIGTTNPGTYKLNVAGNANIANSLNVFGPLSLGSTLSVNSVLYANGAVLLQTDMAPAAGYVLTARDNSGWAQWKPASGGGGGGTGTVTSVGTGAGLSGGPITTSGTISLNTAYVNTWTGAQTFSGGANFPGGVWNTSGNVGIGTTNPGAYKLFVSGTNGVQGSVTTGIGVSGSSSSGVGVFGYSTSSYGVNGSGYVGGAFQTTSASGYNLRLQSRNVSTQGVHLYAVSVIGGVACTPGDSAVFNNGARALCMSNY